MSKSNSGSVKKKGGKRISTPSKAVMLKRVDTKRSAAPKLASAKPQAISKDVGVKNGAAPAKHPQLRAVPSKLSAAKVSQTKSNSNGVPRPNGAVYGRGEVVGNVVRASTAYSPQTNLVLRREPGARPENPFARSLKRNDLVKTEERVLAVVPEFHQADKVVYPAHGVGVIDAVQIRQVSGSEQKFYMITILETGMKIMVPVSQAAVVGLRRIVDQRTVEKVYEILRDRKVTIDTQTWNRRYREYTQKIKTGSVFEIAKVIRDLSVLKGDKELSFGERKMLDTAQGLLVKEISIAKSSPEDTIKAELARLFDAAI